MEGEHTSGTVGVAELLGEELAYLRLKVLSGEKHLDNLITHPRVQKPGLAFAGYYAYIKPGRVQIIGESETEYLRTLGEEEREQRLQQITSLPVPVFVITKGLEPLPGFLSLCQSRELPVLSSPALSSTVIKGVSYFLEDHLVPSTSLHGVLLEIYGLGVLLIGGEWGGEERVGPRPHHPRPQPGRRRQGDGQALSQRRVGRLQRGPPAAPYGVEGGSASSTFRISSASPRCASGRPSISSSSWSTGATGRPTTDWGSTSPCTTSWILPAPTSACPSPWDETSASWWRSRPATTC